VAKKIMMNCAVSLWLGLGASAVSAQSSVKLYGVVDSFIGSMRLSGDAHSKNTVSSSGMTTSHWGLIGKEDLGNGLSADFALESFFRVNNGKTGRFDGDPLFARNAYVGLSGNFGGVKLGRNTTPWFVSMLLSNPLADAEVFSPLFLHTFTTPPGYPVASTVAGDTNWNDSVLYTSPVMNGVQFNAIYARNDVEGKSAKQNFGGNILYFGENFKATFAIQRVGVEAAEFAISGAKSQVAYLAGASYDFKVAKLFASYSQSTNNFDDRNRWRNKTWQVGASVPVGHGVVSAEWARTNQGATNVFGDLRRDTTTLAYNYAFSKRTDVYLAWRYDKVTDYNPGNTVGLGLRHRF
jgi:predicted porin